MVAVDSKANIATSPCSLSRLGLMSVLGCGVCLLVVER
jgi:hypothetical protein